MAGVYRPRHPERTVLYRVLFHYIEPFLTEYENRFEKEYGFLCPIVKEVVERYLDCGNPRCGFARVRCPSCGEERLLMFSCRSRGFCPSCHSKRLEEWGEWMRETLLLDVPHRQVVFVIPKMLRIFFKDKRRLLGDLCQAAVQALLKYLQAGTGTELRPGIVASIQTFGQKINLHVHLHFLVTEGGEDSEGRFHHLASFQDSLLAEFFSREVFALLMREELISEAVVEKIAGWRHSGFSVHSKVRAKTRQEDRKGSSATGHCPPQADICRRETPAAAPGLAGILPGFRGSGRLFLIIFPLSRRRGPPDFQPFPGVSASKYSPYPGNHVLT